MQKSELVIARILSLLMEWGIDSSEMEFSELKLDSEEFGSLFFPCIQWLTDEGIIRTGEIIRTHDSLHSGFVIQPVLTSYGMKVLGRSVVIGGESKPFSDAVRTASASEKSYSQFGDLIGGILGGFTKSIGS